MVEYNLDRRFLHGGDYNPDQWLDHPEIIEDDFRMMQQAKINTVTVGIFAWDILEPREGEFHFEWLDDIFERVNAFGGNVILATPSGGRPHWLSEQYPEVNRTDNMGQQHTHGFRHNHCYSSPLYREKVQIINRKLAERYGKNPALSMWHISNEYSGDCYCHYCQDNWRKWLKNRYGTLENINKAWWLRFWSGEYTSWSQVLPPSPLGETKVHGMDLDWKRFVTDMTIDFYQAEIKPIREITPNIPVTTNFMAEGHDHHDFVPLEGIDYGKFAQYVDVVSWDSYPDWNNDFETVAETAMKSAYVHDQYWSLKQKPFLVMESTPSGVNWHQYNKTKRPGMHVLTSMQQLAHGSDSTLYFQWRQGRGNSEKFHGAVVGVDNSTETRVFKDVEDYGKRINQLGEIKGTTKQVNVGIIFDWDSNWALKRGGGYGRPTRQYPQTLQQHYAVFWEQDIPVDIIPSSADLAKYKILIAPMLYLLDRATIDKLLDYVANGGILIASYFTGMVDKTDLLYAGGWPEKLQAMFGLKTGELDMLYPSEHNQVNFNGVMYETKDYANVIKVSDATILGCYQDEFYAQTPAITEHDFGEGKTYFLATRMGRDFLRVFYQPLIDELKITKDVVSEHLTDVSIQTRYGQKYQYHFIMNFSDENRQLNLLRPVFDMETTETLTGTLVLTPYEVRVVKEKI